MSFLDDIKRFARKTNEKAEKIAVATVFELNRKTILATPVDTGQARGGWVASLNAPSFAKGSKDKSGSSALSKANAVASQATGNIYYLNNSTPYIGVLEFGGYPNPPKKGTYLKKSKSYEKLSQGGYSRQAPGGMARIAIKEARQKFDELARELNGR